MEMPRSKEDEVDAALKLKVSLPALDSIMYEWLVDWDDFDDYSFSPDFECAGLYFNLQIEKKPEKSFAIYLFPRKSPLSDLLQVHFGAIVCHPSDSSLKTNTKG